MLTNLLIPTYTQMLGTMSRWLDKASERPDADALMSARLADDMFPLATQVRFACRQAYEGVARLRGEDIAAASEEMLAEGRDADQGAGTIADAKARIEQTIAFLNTVPADDGDSDPHRALPHTLPNGIVLDLTAEQFARDWTLGQFYFHVMIAYAILRAKGVPLGKADYVGHLLPFVRPGTMPQA